MDSPSVEFSIDFPDELMPSLRWIAALRGQTIEELLEYVLSIAVGLREPDPGDPGGEALYQLSQLYQSGRLGHG